jgi:hypothetical protein
MAYNQGSHKDFGGSTQVVGSSDTLTINGTLVNGTGGTLTNNGTLTSATGGTLAVNGAMTMGAESSLDITTGGKISKASAVFTTASTGSIPVGSVVEVKSTGGTSIAFSLSGTPEIGDSLTVLCTAATATGFVSINVGGGSTTLTFDGTNNVYKCLKSEVGFKIEMVSTGRWMETYRSVADGTSLGSTST